MQPLLCFIVSYSQRVATRWLIFLLSFYVAELRAQTSGTDSLRAVLKQSHNDSVHCQILTTLSETAPDGEWENDNEQLKLLAAQAFYKTKSLSLKKFYLHCFALSLNNKGLILGRMDQPAEEEAHYRAAYSVFKAIRDSSGMTTAISNIGTKYMMRNEQKEALHFFMESLAMSEAMHDREGKARTLMSIGDVQRKMGQTSTALDYYEKSLIMSQAIHDEWQFTLALRRIAGIYYSLYEYEKAMLYLKKSLPICKKTGDMDGYSEAMTTLSVIDMGLNIVAAALASGAATCYCILQKYNSYTGTMTPRR
jgi:tetratricopeptide (TPR) repeat protein